LLVFPAIRLLLWTTAASSARFARRHRVGAQAASDRRRRQDREKGVAAGKAIEADLAIADGCSLAWKFVTRRSAWVSPVAVGSRFPELVRNSWPIERATRNNEGLELFGSI
jgi:hypothetical protein